MGATHEELDDAVAGRMERQRVLDREHPPELWVILDEAVLRRPVGGPDVMREQLARLVESGQRPNIAIQVVPFGPGAHEGLRGGAFVVADFDTVTGTRSSTGEGPFYGSHLPRGAGSQTR